ncbi:MAG: CocE/NonD family hydrolase, partial [Planctomycetota bacterium]
MPSIATLRAAWPMLRRAIASGQLWRPQCELREPSPDVVAEFDVPIPMQEGFELTCSVFRSRSRTDAAPVVMCAHPYDNRIVPALGRTPLGGPPQQYRLIRQAGGRPAFSTWTSWESPDPSTWVEAGYSLVNLNLPGYGSSGGPPSVLSTHQADCFAEAIEFVAEQDWCDGSVGLLGVSYLAISQFGVAAREGGPPAALKCIAPWEGMTDLYRDVACRGGVDDSGFLSFWWHTEVKEALRGGEESFLESEGGTPPDLLRDRPLFDDFWAEKAFALERINVPMLVCGSFSDHELHTTGSFRAFDRAHSKQKWVYTHRGGKWTTFYSPEVEALLRDFMDHFLKGESNRFDSLPAVRLEVRADRDTIHETRWEEGWPLPSSTFRRFHLRMQGTVGTLAEDADEAPGEVVYHARRGRAEFDLLFERATEVSGPRALELWVEVRPASGGGTCPDDMTLCVAVDKLDRDGRSVRFHGSVGIT